MVERKTRWEDVEYKRVSVSSPAIEEFFECVDESYCSGGAFLARFDVTDPKVFSQALHDNYFDLNEIAHAFLNAPSARAALPELNIKPGFEVDLFLEESTPLAWEGTLAHMLLIGGADGQLFETVDYARRVCHAFVQELVGTNWLHSYVGYDSGKWAGWFWGEEWDETFVVYDRDQVRFWLLCLTDMLDDDPPDDWVSRNG